MLNLMLHCGAHRADREEVMSAPTPSRTRPGCRSRITGCSSTSNPRCHSVHIVNEVHGHEGARYFGLMEIQNGRNHGDYGGKQNARIAAAARWTGCVLGPGAVARYLSSFEAWRLFRGGRHFLLRSITGCVCSHT